MTSAPPPLLLRPPVRNTAVRFSLCSSWCSWVQLHQGGRGREQGSVWLPPPALGSQPMQGSTGDGNLGRHSRCCGGVGAPSDRGFLASQEEAGL